VGTVVTGNSKHETRIPKQFNSTSTNTPMFKTETQRLTVLVI
jgi:hypothetical protein